MLGVQVHCIGTDRCVFPCWSVMVFVSPSLSFSMLDNRPRKQYVVTKRPLLLSEAYEVQDRVGLKPNSNMATR